MTKKKSAPAPAAEQQPQRAQDKKPCRANEVGHRSCGCPDCDHNAKRK